MRPRGRRTRKRPRPGSPLPGCLALVTPLVESAGNAYLEQRPSATAMVARRQRRDCCAEHCACARSPMRTRPASQRSRDVAALEEHRLGSLPAPEEREAPIGERARSQALVGARAPEDHDTARGPIVVRPQSAREVGGTSGSGNRARPRGLAPSSASPTPSSSDSRGRRTRRCLRGAPTSTRRPSRVPGGTP